MFGFGSLERLFHDIKFALRTLRRSPLFTSIAVLSLALGIGANTAIFSLMDQLLLRLLPVKDPESLVMLYQRGPNMGGNDGERANSYPILPGLPTQSGGVLASILPEDGGGLHHSRRSD